MNLTQRILALSILSMLAPYASSAMTSEEREIEAAIQQGLSSSSSPNSGVDFARAVKEKIRLIRQHAEANFLLSDALMDIESLLSHNPFRSFTLEPREGLDILNHLTLTLNTPELSELEAAQVYSVRQELSDLIESKVKQLDQSRWAAFGRALSPTIEPYLRSISIQLYEHILKHTEGSLTFSQKMENDPTFTLDDALQNIVADAANSTEEQLRKAYQDEETERSRTENRTISFPFPPQDSLENKWTARRQVAFSTFLELIATGKYLPSRIWEAKDTAHISSVDAVIPSPAMQTLFNQWLESPNLGFAEIQIAYQQEVARQETQRAEALQLEAAQAAAEHATLVAQKETAQLSEVLAVLHSSNTERSAGVIPTGITLTQATELLRTNFAQSQGVRMDDTAPTAQGRILRIRNMTTAELITRSKATSFGR